MKSRFGKYYSATQSPRMAGHTVLSEYRNRKANTNERPLSSRVAPSRIVRASPDAVRPNFQGRNAMVAMRGWLAACMLQPDAVRYLGARGLGAGEESSSKRSKKPGERQSHTTMGNATTEADGSHNLINHRRVPALPSRTRHQRHLQTFPNTPISTPTLSKSHLCLAYLTPSYLYPP